MTAWTLHAAYGASKWALRGLTILLSDRSSLITGAELVIDGGQTTGIILGTGPLPGR